jgi:hypothetical protein
MRYLAMRSEELLPVWQSGLATARPPLEIVIPANLVDLAAGLAVRLGPREFAILLEGAWEGVRLVIRDWYVPLQKCTAWEVTLLEDPPQRYTGALHRHPPGVVSFSALDEAYFNGNLAFSILYLPPREFPVAEVYLPLNADARVAVPARCTVGPALPEAERASPRVLPAGEPHSGDHRIHRIQVQVCRKFGPCLSRTETAR